MKILNIIIIIVITVLSTLTFQMFLYIKNDQVIIDNNDIYVSVLNTQNSSILIVKDFQTNKVLDKSQIKEQLVYVLTKDNIYIFLLCKKEPCENATQFIIEAKIDTCYLLFDNKLIKGCN